MSVHTGWSAELERDLATPFPSEAMLTKTLKGTKISFVPWHFYVQRLNYLLGGGWAMEAPIPMQAGGKLVVAVGLTILGVTRWNVGDEDADHEGFGSSSTNAFAQGYKRAAALFGMGLDLYDKHGTADAVRVSQVEQEDHAAMIQFIRSAGESIPDDAMMPQSGKAPVPLKQHLRERWAAIKEQPRMARAAVDAIEVATRLRYTPSRES